MEKRWVYDISCPIEAQTLKADNAIAVQIRQIL